MSDSSRTTKKRKANDGGATVLYSRHDGGGSSRLTSRLGNDTAPTASSTTCGGENLTQKLDAVMQMVSRVEEKLTTVSSLESRCERLEAECSSLKTMLETKTNAMKEHVDSKISSLVRHHEYNTMLVKNQSWKYSVPVHSQEHWENNGYNEDEAAYLTPSSDCLKEFTEIMRRGEFPSVYNDGRKGIDLNWAEEDPILDNNAIRQMRPHWEEFAEALEQFNPAFGVLPDSCGTFFVLENIQLPRYVPQLLKDVLMNNPFQTLSFVNKVGVGDNVGDGGMTIDNIIDIMESNKHLRKLTIGNNRIQLGHMDKICSAVCRGSIVELGLYNCFENGLGYAMITSLLTSGGLAKLEKLGFVSNGITSNGIALLANFLATNPMLKELDLHLNRLNDHDAEALSTALRSNTSLRNLDLSGNTISDAGDEAFRLVLHNDSSLNSIADSNHSCSVGGVGFSCLNVYGYWKNGDWHEAPASFNRAGKIYKLLSTRNESMPMSNVQHFGDIDVKLLPSILEAVQRYAITIHRAGYCRVEPLSIVYEVMRKWDKVFPLYTD